MQIIFREEQQPLLNQLPPPNSNRVVTLATGLNLFTFQGVIGTDRGFLVATLDNAIVQVQANGKVSRLVNLAQYGSPAGVAEHNGNLIVTVSAEEMGDFLVRVAPNGKVSIIADLIDVCGGFGTPFGVAVGDGFYAVAIATDVSSSSGCLARVSFDGHVSIFADLPGQGIPFGVAPLQQGFAVTVEQGKVLHVVESGQFKTLADLAKTGYGIPFGIASYGNQLVLVTNEGYLLNLAIDGQTKEIANLKADGFGIPASVAIVPPKEGANPVCLVTTIGGNLLGVNLS